MIYPQLLEPRSAFMPRSIGRLRAALLVVGALVAVALLSGPAHAQSDTVLVSLTATPCLRG